MAQRHTWTGVAHDLDHPLAHLAAVAVCGALIARRLGLTENAVFQALPCIAEQVGAFATQVAFSVMVAAVDMQHHIDGSLFAPDTLAAIGGPQARFALWLGWHLHAAIMRRNNRKHLTIVNEA